MAVAVRRALDTATLLANTPVWRALSAPAFGLTSGGLGVSAHATPHEDSLTARVLTSLPTPLLTSHQQTEQSTSRAARPSAVMNQALKGMQ